MLNAYREYWNNIITMNASTAQAQYWWPQLINYLVLGIYSAITGVYRYIEVTPNDGTTTKEWNAMTIIFFLLTVLIWLANFTIRARRLHGCDHSNWWVLFYLPPFIGTLVIFTTLILPSKSHTRWPANQSEIQLAGFVQLIILGVEIGYKSFRLMSYFLFYFRKVEMSPA